MTALKSGEYVFNPKTIDEVRKRMGLTQQEFADRLGIAKTAISRWEQGKVTPDASSLAAIYSIAKTNRIEPVFFKKIEAKPKEGRSNLFVSWDYQNTPLPSKEAVEKAKLIRDKLTKKFPSVSHTVFKVFASSKQASVTNEIGKQGWRLEEFDSDIDEELDSQAWSDCNQAPQDTLFVLITKDGDFTDLIEELRKRGVRVYLMAPEKASQKLVNTVGRKNRITFPA